MRCAFPDGIFHRHARRLFRGYLNRAKARVSGTHMRIKINFAERSFTLQAAGEAMYLPATNREGEIIVLDEDDIEDRKDRDERAAERYNRSLTGQLMQQVQAGGAAGGATPSVAPRSDPNDPGFSPYAVEAKAVPRRTPPPPSAWIAPVCIRR